MQCLGKRIQCILIIGSQFDGLLFLYVQRQPDARNTQRHNRFAPLDGAQHFPLLPNAMVGVMAQDARQQVGLVDPRLDAPIPILVPLWNGFLITPHVRAEIFQMQVDFFCPSMAMTTARVADEYSQPLEIDLIVGHILIVVDLRCFSAIEFDVDAYCNNKPVCAKPSRRWAADL